MNSASQEVCTVDAASRASTCDAVPKACTNAHGTAVTFHVVEPPNLDLFLSVACLHFATTCPHSAKNLSHPRDTDKTGQPQICDTLRRARKEFFSFQTSQSKVIRWAGCTAHVCPLSLPVKCLMTCALIFGAETNLRRGVPDMRGTCREAQARS